MPRFPQISIDFSQIINLPESEHMRNALLRLILLELIILPNVNSEIKQIIWDLSQAKAAEFISVARRWINLTI